MQKTEIEMRRGLAVFEMQTEVPGLYHYERDQAKEDTGQKVRYLCSARELCIADGG